MTIRFSPAPARLADGERVYAIGDVHGCLDRLRAMHEAIADDLRERPVARAVLVHIGDYIDRGPNSAGVVAMLAQASSPEGISETVNLLGNHEDMFLGALEQRTEEAVSLWLMNGGAATLASWGIGRAMGVSEWQARIPPPQLHFIRGLRLTHTIGPYLFVHAGLRPDVPLERQERADLIWIRGPFLHSRADFGAVVVHGHTPTQRPEVRANRIGIDTGAVMGGVLSCAVLEDDTIGFIER
jgi:serine/threonine protein phosphatase 1